MRTDRSPLHRFTCAAPVSAPAASRPTSVLRNVVIVARLFLSIARPVLVALAVVVACHAFIQ